VFAGPPLRLSALPEVPRPALPAFALPPLAFGCPAEALPPLAGGAPRLAFDAGLSLLQAPPFSAAVTMPTRISAILERIKVSFNAARPALLSGSQKSHRTRTDRFTTAKHSTREHAFEP
jgi:hypothetical protein